MKQQFISKPNKIFRCISNRTTALIYLTLILVLFVFNIIYSGFFYEKKVRVFTCIWHVMIIIDLISEIYSIIKKNETSTSKHFKSIVICFAIVIYVIIAVYFLLNYMKKDFTIQSDYKETHPDTKLSDSEIVKTVKRNMIIFYLILILVVAAFVAGSFLFYYPYMKEVGEDKKDRSYSRMIESGEGDRESIH